MIVIPAYQPNENLVNLIKAINKESRNPLLPILIIDDGSTSDESKNCFCKILQFKNVKVLVHNFNQGKGSALKTGIKYALQNNYPFIITADADGQHLAKDIYEIWCAAKIKNKFIIGTRVFTKEVPFRSRFGNKITSLVFKIVTGQYLTDTQSGLRAIPKTLYKKFLKIKSNRYDFELNSLLYVAKLNNLSTLKIETVYEIGNPSSHFRPLVDSSLIYLVFLRYCLVAVLISAFDFIGFLTLSIFIHTTIAFLLIRFLSISIYYITMKKIVFNNRDTNNLQRLGFLFLVGLNITITYFLVNYINNFDMLTKSLTYMFINISMAIFNFYIMKSYIFILKKTNF